ncbi:arylsulfatase [Plakobranchus ocellatus]|uniref:Arylsulfatase n=1 Tax=Plakobranchus ocellatus TaxID=259542 RepID=A0AAV3Y8Y7_9GAST|nr:arylsulfatase [Plakobranchus ocellatus]
MYSLWLFILALGVPVIDARKPPNIVFILADDLGWHDVGFHGSEIKTPYMDKLAYEGVILNNYYVQPICTPTRGAVLSGKYPIHTGLQHYVIIGSEPYGLPLSVKTMPQHLKDLGYSTHMVGKWHLGMFKRDYLPENRGFETHFGYYMGHGDYFDHYAEDGGDIGYDLHYNGETFWKYKGNYSTEFYTKRAENIIRTHNTSKPLFLYLAHQAVHAGNGGDPIEAPQAYIDRFPYIKNIKRRMFAGVVSALDDSVGAVYKALQDSGMADNTIIVFSTDNGGPTNGYDQNAACNWPLRGNKNTLWQGGVRGVGFVHSPLLKKPGRVVSGMMHVVDWLPTLLQAAQGGELKQGNGLDPDLDGVGMWSEISTGTSQSWPRQEVLLNIDPVGKFGGVIVGDFKLVYGKLGDGGWYPPPSEVMNETSSSSNDFHPDSLVFKPEAELSEEGDPIIVKCGPKPSNDTVEKCQPDEAPCLFNLRKDPCEYNNLASEFPNIVWKLQERLANYNSTMVPPGNKPEDPRGLPKNNGGVWKPWM